MSLIIHALVVLYSNPKLKELNLQTFKDQTKPLKIHSIRQVGEEKARDIKTSYIEQKKQKIGKKLQAKQLAPQFSNNSPAKKQKTQKEKQTPLNKLALRPKAIEALKLNKKSIANFLQATPNATSSQQYLEALGDTDSIVRLEVPKGVKESELNKHELVFYSFQKRTAITYINSFYKKLNEFKMKNPHLHFPMTEKKENMVGRVIYDKDGNIVKINMMKWTKVNKLQDFFMDVLQEMTALPNPPKAILKDGQFTVFFALTVNG